MSGVVVGCYCLVGGICQGCRGLLMPGWRQMSGSSWVANAWLEANVRGRRELLMTGWRQMSGVVVGC